MEKRDEDNILFFSELDFVVDISLRGFLTKSPLEDNGPLLLCPFKLNRLEYIRCIFSWKAIVCLTCGIKKWLRYILMPVYEVWGKVMLSLAPVILFRGGGLPSHNTMGRQTPIRSQTHPQKEDQPQKAYHHQDMDTVTGYKSTNRLYASYLNAYVYSV